MTKAPAQTSRRSDRPRDTTWSPNQQAVRWRISAAAAQLAAREGLGACTIRGVAEEADVPKSTVHYYVRDANELVDLAVLTFLQQFADHLSTQMTSLRDGPEALSLLVRGFMGRGDRALSIKDPTLWSQYTSHAWSRGASQPVLICFETFHKLFETALERCDVPDRTERARSIHLYLLGAVQRHLVQAMPRAEVARTVSTLAGVTLNPRRC
jgi:AcrR family transcriptional regulator